ncbi:class I SAM-dependent methyltransferase [Actinocrispum wychmicini]|uniref:Methyltransferase family protein n=1 Tax=Actinocrispum wychmicini TaxID=1213861 RepID=A0A4R2J4B3_9PSEU|nr:class I SAM-dependent methyltransferase [Actinocrispum wychmicini]TCO53493.1 methyltransferase family protein [Actinocrispum wychmicini]
MNSQSLYNVGYRYARMPWEIGARAELIGLVRSGRLRRGRAIDLGCGTGANSIFLAQQGFDVTGVDFAPAALVKARAAAERAEVDVHFVLDDLTSFRHDHGTFDVLVDYGVLDDLSPERRDQYLANVLPLARPDSQFLLWCFEWPPRRWERWVGMRTMEPGEVNRRFGDRFAIERVAGTAVPAMWRFIPGFAAYLMTRRDLP